MPQKGRYKYECPDSVDYMSKNYNFFEKGANHWYKAAIAKSGDEYFFRLQFAKPYSVHFMINEDNPIIIQFENGETLKLFPACNFKGYGLIVYNMCAFYNITKEQLKKLTMSPVERFSYYVTSEKKIETAQKSDEGWFFDFEIKSKKRRKNCMEAAKCMLAKQ